MMQRRLWLWLVALLCCVCLRGKAEQTQPSAAAVRPKYAATTLPLSRSHAYFRGHAAPDFWRLIPYYASQQTDSDCSVAVAAMLVNAARSERSLPSDEELVTLSGLLRKLDDSQWTRAVAEGGDGLTLDELAKRLERSLAVYDVPAAEIRAEHLASADDAAIAGFRRRLIANEQSGRDLIVCNFLQSALTGDPEGAVGHFAPVGAFDADHDRVLILDPDRRWYEPYWVPVKSLVEGMSTCDAVSGKARGYLFLRWEAH